MSRTIAATRCFPILSVPGKLSSWSFISRGGARGWRRQIAKCQKSFSDFAAYYCSADCFGVSHRESRRRRGIIEKYPAAGDRREERVAQWRPSLGLHFSTSKLLLRRSLPRDTKRENRKESHGKKVSSLAGVPRWTFTKISNQKSKTSPTCPARVPMKNFSYARRRMLKLVRDCTPAGNECPKTLPLPRRDKSGKVNSLPRAFEGFAPSWDRVIAAQDFEIVNIDR